MAVKFSKKWTLISVVAIVGAMAVLVVAVYPEWQEYREQKRAEVVLHDIAHVKPLDINAGSYPK